MFKHVAGLLSLLTMLIITSCSSHSTALSPTPTPTTIPTNTPMPTMTPLPNIWQTVKGVDYGKGLAFDPEHALTGYTCGTTDNLFSNLRPLEWGVTADGGFTWSPSTSTGILGNNCRIAINPFNSDDIVLTSYVCWDGCGDDPGIWNRSLDGGKSWNRLALPGTENSGMSITQLAWTTNALVVIAGYSESIGNPPPTTHSFAVSSNGGALAWTAQDPSFGVPLFTGITSLFADGASIKAYGEGEIAGQLKGIIATSSDNGATWTHFTMVGAPDSTSITPIRGGNTLIGGSNRAYMQSQDGGKTWTSLPTLPGGPMMITQGLIIATADGTLFIELQSSTNTFTGTKSGMYKLIPGAATWTFVTAFQGQTNLSRQIDVISSDTNGHPVALWSTSISGTGLSDIKPLLEYHPA